MLKMCALERCSIGIRSLGSIGRGFLDVVDHKHFHFAFLRFQLQPELFSHGMKDVRIVGLLNAGREAV